MSENLDLQEILKRSEAQTNFPDVPLDEFTTPTYDEWKEACIALLKGAPFEKKMYTKTPEGITFEPMYFHNDTEPLQPKTFPGMGDHVRGSNVDGYIKKPWGIAQICDETFPAENNEVLKHEIEKGSTIYNIKLDTATRKCQDPRHTEEKVGDVGVSLTTFEDVETLLKDLKLEQYPIYMYTGETAFPMIAMVAAAVKKSGQDLSKLHGVIGADPIGELVLNGKTIHPVSSLCDGIMDCVKWSLKNAPGLKTIFIRSDVYSDGGANDVQEIAYSLASAVAYIRALIERGLTIDEAAQQIMFQFSMGSNFFMQIAKLRAVKPIWTEIIQAFGGNEESQKIHIHARPALFCKTVYDPYVNMLRNTTEIFSGVVGGLDSFENAPFDEPIRKGDEFSRRIARNVQIILQEEFGLLQPIDPAGGSWAVETLTHQIRDLIWKEFQTIESKGGILEALKEGYPQAEIAKVLADRFKSAELRRERIVGNNMYPNMTEERLDARVEDFDANKKARSEQISKYLDKFPADSCIKVLDKLVEAPNFDKLSVAIEAVTLGATIPTIRESIGTQEVESVEPIKPHRLSEKFEALRARTEKYKAEKNDNVKIFLANMGPIPQHKARADFTTGFLQVGAFQVLGNNGFKTTDEAAAAAKESGADAVVICSTDATYPEIVPDLAPKLHNALPNATVFLAGAAPAEMVETYKTAGIDEYISVRANCYKILESLQQKKGMIA